MRRTGATRDRAAPTPEVDASTAARWGEFLLLGCTLAILALVLVQSLVTIIPVTTWDMDPRRMPAGLTATELTPSAMSWINFVSVFVAAVAMAAHAHAGGRIAWTSTALSLAGIAACLYHAPAHIQNLTRCPTWAAAASLALAAHHLAHR